MKLNVEQLKEAHFQIDQFIRDPKLYGEALKRSKNKAIDLVKARAMINKAIELLGDDAFFDVVAMLEDGVPLAADEHREMCRLNNEGMTQLLGDPEVVRSWAVMLDMLGDYIPELK